MVMKRSSNPNYSRDGKHHQEGSDRNSDNDFIITCLSSEIEELDRLLNALDQYKFSRKVRRKATKRAIGNLLQMRRLARVLGGFANTTERSLPLRYDQHGNCFRWMEEANEWLPFGTLCTPPWRKE